MTVTPQATTHPSDLVMLKMLLKSKLMGLNLCFDSFCLVPLPQLSRGGACGLLTCPVSPEIFSYIDDLYVKNTNL